MRSVLCTVVALAALAGPALAPTAAAQASAPIDPAEGFWYDPERPGSGFSLERRGDTVALTAYDFADHVGATAANRWRLAAAPLVDNEVVATLQSYANGSCFGCEAFTASEPQPGTSTLRLTFDSARSAMLQVDELPPRRVVSVPFGSTYLHTSFAPADVPLPDLSGTWLFAEVGGDGSGILTIALEEQGDGFVSYGGAAYGLDQPYLTGGCAVFEADPFPSCRLAIFPGLEMAPPPRDIGRLQLGDIGEDRMTGVDGLGRPVVFHRLGDTEVQP